MTETLETLTKRVNQLEKVIEEMTQQPGLFSFKKSSGFMSFFKDPVRLETRTYRAWGVQNWAKKQRTK